MNLITLYPPEVASQRVTFRWRVIPSTTLYRAQEFSLRFPDGIDLARIPGSMWWMIAMLTLHSQWALLRPCRVKIPFKLREGEAETWLRLIDSYIFTLEAHRGRSDLERSVFIQDDGPLLDIVKLSEGTRFATSFSGGKDSLLQVGLLCELTQNPLLVATTSSMPPLEDHITERRRHVFKEISRRRRLTFVEIESDYRANFDHGYAQNIGYWISVNELTDTFIYLASLIAVAYSLGVSHLCLASEIQVNETANIDGRVIQHRHFMYSIVTQAVLSALIQPWGMSLSSLTCPLHSFQVQKLLWTRYADLRDLQYSCWKVKASESICNACTQCLRIALSALAIKDDPGLIGTDMIKLLNSTTTWSPREVKTGPQLPTEVASYQLEAHLLRSVNAIPNWRCHDS